MFLSILPSYMEIYIISLIVKEFCQVPISFLCELFHMKMYCWCVYGGGGWSHCPPYSTVLIQSCNINLVPTSLIRNVVIIFIYILNMLYLKIHQVNVKTKIIVAIFWRIYMTTKVMKVKSLSRVRLFATAWTLVYQAHPYVGFSRQEYWSGLPFPSPTW